MKNPIRESFIQRFWPHREAPKGYQYLDIDIANWLSTFDGCALVRKEPEAPNFEADWTQALETIELLKGRVCRLESQVSQLMHQARTGVNLIR